MAKGIVALLALVLACHPLAGQVNKLKSFGDKRHNVITSTISYDGAYIATAGDDNELIVWDYNNTNLYRKLTGLDQWTKALAFSRDGKLLISGGKDSKVYIWDIDKASIARNLTGHSGDICALAVNPQNNLLASGGDDNTIRIWELSSGRLLQSLSKHSKTVTSLDFSPNGTSLISGSADGSLIIWDTSRWTTLHTISDHRGWVRCVVYSPTGETFASGGDDRYIRIYSSTGALKYELKGHRNWVQCLSYSADGKYVVSGSHDKTFIVWSAVSGTEVYKSPSLGEIVYSVGLNPNGKSILATNLRSSDMSLWDVGDLHIFSTVAPSQTTASTTKPEEVKVVQAVVETKTPQLALKSVLFTDANKNNIINAGEQSFIDISISNTGNGVAKMVKLFVTEQNNVSGLTFSPFIEVGDIAAGQTKSARVYIQANESIASATANFSITITESRGYSCSPAELAIVTRKQEVPLVVLHEHSFTPIGSDIISKGSKFKLSLKVQNKGDAPAYSVKVKFELPDNAFIVSEPEFFVAQLTPNETKVFDLEVMTNTRYIRPDVPIEVFVTESTGKYGDRKIASARLNEGAQGNLTTPMLAATTQAQSAISPKPTLKSDVDIDIPKSASKKPNRYALIIGNEDYSSYQRGLKTESNVEFAVSDAESFRNYATNIMGVPEENVILRTNATAMEMHRAISQINTIIKIGEGNSEVFVMYAGHGFPDEKTQEPYLIPVDVSGADLQFAIKLTDFYAKLTEHPSKRVTVFLDACFSGGGREQGLIAARGVKLRPRENVLKGNLVVFAATSGDQSALPWKEKNHGMFTYHLLQKLKETKGDITYQELSDYLKHNVATRSVLVNQKEQNPQTNISSDVVDTWGNWRLK
jgi:WD40 repeat protein